MLVKRIPLSTWPLSSLSWSTQFNDLRDPKIDKTWSITRELKKQGLFQFRTVIRDADVVNNLPLMNLILDNKEKLQTGVSHGLYVFALRSPVESLTEVNEIAGKRRAYPKRYVTAKPLVARLDALLTTEDVYVAEVERANGADTFKGQLDRILKFSSLDNESKELLRKAIVHSAAMSSERLRFGDLYSYLKGSKRPTKVSEIIQWCRAAHVLTVPAELGIAASSADQDLSPAHVAFILGRGEDISINPTPWLDLFPKRILTDEALDKLTFEDIVRLRHQGDKVGYFDSVMSLHAGIRSRSYESAFVSYLKSLEEYLIAIGLDAKVELVNWQSTLIGRHLNIQELNEQGVTFSIPVILTAAYSLITHTPFPISEACGAIMGLEILRKIHRIRKPAPLQRLISGTTVAPPLG